MTRNRMAFLVAGLLLAGAILSAQARRPGDPLAGLTAVEFAEFRLGLDDFLEVEASGEGLGPAFNGTSCAVCHNVPAVGGMGTIAELRAAKRNEAGEFEAALRGRRNALPAVLRAGSRLSAAGACRRERLRAADSDSAVRRRSGRGDPGQLDSRARGSRRPRTTTASAAAPPASSTSPRGTTRVGRFGWKAQHATLLAFSADAYRNEMGITNDLFPGRARRRRHGRSDEGVRSVSGSGGSAATRARAAAASTTSPASCASSRRSSGSRSTPRSPRGEQVFAGVGCATCHVPSLTTAQSANPAVRSQDRCRCSQISCCTTSAPATASSRPRRCADEIRTPALWGLRFRRPLLHDGSAATIERGDPPSPRRSRVRAKGVRDPPRRRPQGAPRIPAEPVTFRDLWI